MQEAFSGVFKGMQFFLLQREETRDLLPAVLSFYQIEMIDLLFMGFKGGLIPKVSILILN